ncbi:hypothetical protein, partial [Nostoc linckia]|uniref:hypothetical protein n=1 Tax=Nostoc linckia TaxID=92942 RepID=UPI000C02D557
PAKTPPPAPRVDEFSDLEKLLAEADQTISHSALTKPNTTKTPRPQYRCILWKFLKSQYP